MKTQCEWNPLEDRTAYIDEHDAEAEFIVGSKVNYFLCGKCANLPFFKRYRYRKELLKKEG